MKNENSLSNDKPLIVIKASGEKDLFSPEKLIRSLQKAGANDEAINLILSKMQSQLHDGISTSKIYHIAFSLLKRKSKPTASKYKLKKAIFELGPTGLPFELFIAEMLKKQGYQVQVGQILKGRCVQHEVDVLAEKFEKHFMVECKFHQTGGIFCTVKIPLHVQARFKDIELEWQKQEGHESKFHQGWVVTNTRFSSDAIQYGICTGLNLAGWNYPQNGSLNKLIDSLSLYPITCLHSLTAAEKQQLLNVQIILCKDICNNERLLLSTGIAQNRIGVIMKEAKLLCDQ